MNADEKDAAWTAVWYQKTLLEAIDASPNKDELGEERNAVEVTIATLEGLIHGTIGEEAAEEPAGSLVVGADGWLVGVRRERVDLGEGGLPSGEPDLCVVHFTAGASGMSSIDYWRSSRAASAHIVIERDGEVIQCRSFKEKAWHAGTSSWKGRSGCNDFSVGIELANGGDAYPSKFSDLEPTSAAHKNGGGAKLWETFPDAQIRACVEVMRALQDNWPSMEWAGHDDIAPDRKNDPGPAFPWDEVRGLL